MDIEGLEFLSVRSFRAVFEKKLLLRNFVPIRAR